MISSYETAKNYLDQMSIIPSQGGRPEGGNVAERAQAYALLAIVEKLGQINHSLELLVSKRVLGS